MNKRTLGKWAAGTMAGLAGLLSNSSCIGLSDFNTTKNQDEGRQLTVYEGDVKDWTEIEDFYVGSAFDTSPAGVILTSHNNDGNALPPFNTRLVCEQITDAKKDCGIEIRDNDIDHYTNGNKWTIDMHPVPTGYLSGFEKLTLTWMKGRSPDGVYEELSNGDSGDSGDNGYTGNSGDSGNSGSGGMACNDHTDCPAIGEPYCFEGSVHGDFYACVGGECSDVGLASGQFVEWCANGCSDGVCLPESNGNTGNSGNEGDSGDSGNTGNSGDSGNTGNGGNSGNSGNSGLECMVDSDCGTNNETLYCVGNYDIHKDTESYACVGGTCVDNSTYGQWQEYCQGGCANGACLPEAKTTALERLINFNSNFTRPEANGESDIKLYWAEEQGESGSFVYGEFPEEGPQAPVHYEVSKNFMNGKYLIAVGDPDLVGDIGEVIRGTQSTTSMSSAIGGYNPAEAPDFYVFNPDKEPIPQEVFTIMAHGE